MEISILIVSVISDILLLLSFYLPNDGDPIPCYISKLGVPATSLYSIFMSVCILFLLLRVFRKFSKLTKKRKKARSSTTKSDSSDKKSRFWDIFHKDKRKSSNQEKTARTDPENTKNKESLEYSKNRMSSLDTSSNHTKGEKQGIETTGTRNSTDSNKKNSPNSTTSKEHKNITETINSKETSKSGNSVNSTNNEKKEKGKVIIIEHDQLETKKGKNKRNGADTKSTSSTANPNISTPGGRREGTNNVVEGLKNKRFEIWSYIGCSILSLGLIFILAIPFGIYNKINQLIVCRVISTRENFKYFVVSYVIWAFLGFIAALILAILLLREIKKPKFSSAPKHKARTKEMFARTDSQTYINRLQQDYYKKRRSLNEYSLKDQGLLAPDIKKSHRASSPYPLTGVGTTFTNSSSQSPPPPAQTRKRHSLIYNKNVFRSSKFTKLFISDQLDTAMVRYNRGISKKLVYHIIWFPLIPFFSLVFYLAYSLVSYLSPLGSEARRVTFIIYCIFHSSEANLISIAFLIDPVVKNAVKPHHLKKVFKKAYRRVLRKPLD
ncbi:hypothetical protein BB560_000077 [Smittium megazygosporum]|uniref:Uncharacterized protein n=1 Tax=Smittium megazygosporum TaxID=133381 RepID=A0A2T9ZLD2_9FUNG|nr:hypothetical protein BB560_000077 [Smittium megazygosporum]